MKHHMTFQTAIKIFFASLVFFIGVMLGSIYFGAWFIGVFVVVWALAMAAFIVATGIAMLSGAPFVPSNNVRVREMLRLAAIQPGERAVDLGSGDGRLVIAAARQGALAEGWEVGLFLWLWSRANISAQRLSGRATTKLGSFWSMPLHEVDIVFVYLLPQYMPRLEKKLRAEMRPGSRIVSNAFTFPGWEPEEKNGQGVYLYRVR